MLVSVRPHTPLTSSTRDVIASRAVGEPAQTNTGEVRLKLERQDAVAECQHCAWIADMSVILTVAPKCTLAVSNAAPGESR